MLVSCTDVIEEVSEPITNKATQKFGKLVFNITVNQPNKTRAVKSDWENGDIVYVFFNNVAIDNTPRYVTLTYDGNDWTPALSDGWDGTGLTESGATMNAVYFPFSRQAWKSPNWVPLLMSKDGSSYTFGAKDMLVSTYDGYSYPLFSYYLKSEGSSYTLTSTGDITTLSGTLNMTIPDNFVQFYMPASGGKYNADWKYRLAVQKVKPVSCYSIGSDGIFVQKDRAYGEPMTGYKYGDGVLFSGIIDASAWSSAEERRILLFDTEGPALTQTFTKTLASHDAVKLPNTGWVRAVPEPGKVDLYGNGSIYWADKNVGASTLDGFGLYFTYGEIVPWSEDPLWCFKESPATVNNYWCMDGSHLIKYNADCTLDAYDDPGTVYFGPDWRTPTGGEAITMAGNTWSAGWVYPVDGGNRARSVTGTGGIIYLPAAGYLDDGNLHRDEGWYLTRTDPTASNRWGDYQNRSTQMHFNETNNYVETCSRSWFISVRPVTNVAP